MWAGVWFCTHCLITRTAVAGGGWGCGEGGRLRLAGCWSFHAWQPHRHAGIQSDTGRKLGAVHRESVQVHFVPKHLSDRTTVLFEQKVPGAMEPDKFNPCLFMF